MRVRHVSAALGTLATQALFARGAPAASDPCAPFAGQAFVVPAQALACLKSFPFNETLRQNVLTNIARVFDFYTFEEFYLNSPPPFQESTTNIRADIARINSTKFEVMHILLRSMMSTNTSLFNRRITTLTGRFTISPPR